MLHYLVRGPVDRPVVLFLHGFMGSGADWEEIGRALERHYRCIAVDLPGHGQSVALPAPAYTFDGCTELLEDVLHREGIERASVVGYSMGGRLALFFALRYPDRCRRLVLESASPGLSATGEREARREVDEARARALEAGNFRAFLDRWYRQPLFETLAARPGLVLTMIERRLRNDPEELARALRGLGTGWQPSLWERLPELQVSTLAVAGALDGKYVEIAEHMAVVSPKIRTAVVPNTGHNVHEENAGAFRDILKDYLSSP